MKEHPFFSTIDWDALSRKQVTPPFKPVVESDESTNNFDPEFTGTDLSDYVLDEDDPSEDWVMGSYSGSGFHTPNGPLGSDKGSRSNSSSSLGSLYGGFGGLSMTGGGGASAGGTESGVDIKGSANNGKVKRPKKEKGSPLTNSVQENFRGFSYSGGESVMDDLEFGRGHHGKSDDEGPEPTSEEEYTDFSRSAGRYARGKRKGLGFTEVDA